MSSFFNPILCLQSPLKGIIYIYKRKNKMLFIRYIIITTYATL
ncbi:hypothetical protein BFO_0297 [Tannerella forsythia 92A2]|uniref:Uncharacterized protein n=1 Tax=Tannerella forsythia (strain ATCC 43037 / JCM 10827 / CCUG 21028 A / KCTC 5666 / FDC 338) TaxID=203275 RepID=G8UJL9_TANFA|nr:hypothetical protein BFO_0297 [Tannerella forsythia 92A2]